MLNDIIAEMEQLKDPEKAQVLSGFFKTGKGQYGEGDIFLGIKVPEQRRIAKKFSGLDLEDIRRLLYSKIHEHRLVALLVLINRYRNADAGGRQEVFDFYLSMTERINNWDLVDVSAPNIIGDYLIDKDRDILYTLAKSSSIWERRIAVISTLAFIKKGMYEDTLRISELLLDDKHDLIHKATGWMLRETGKRDQVVEERFLRKYHSRMPRTMLRYAIERFDNNLRKHYMEKG